MPPVDPPPYNPDAARALREAAGMTQQQIADALLLGDKARWAEYERGARAPSAQTWVLALIVAGLHPAYGPRGGPP